MASEVEHECCVLAAILEVEEDGAEDLEEYSDTSSVAGNLLSDYNEVGWKGTMHRQLC